MPSVSGSAPPESDVPAPRGTTLMPLRVAQLQDRGDLRRGLGSTTASGTAR